MKFAIVLLVLGLAHYSWQFGRAPRVKTPLGCIRGFYKQSKSGKTYKAFEGIPYAEPPVGKLRFQPPRPIGKWHRELPATKKGSICTQFRMSPNPNGDRVAGCEDCLYLNIYVPITNHTKGIPVMIWIHGGAYQFDSGNSATEKFIMDREVIFIAINYRLGPFGFLSTGDGRVSGNMGLKDQSLALKWVNTYIEYFGGNSKDITIFGASAGGSSVQYHYLSPLSAGLFQRGISISGVALDPWAQTKHAPEKAKKLGAILGCPTHDMGQMIDCLQDRPARVMAQAVGQFMYWLYNPFTPFGPVIEKSGHNTFIDSSPIDIIAKGKGADLPWITGVVSEEGLYPAAQFVANDKLLKELNDRWVEIAPYLLDYNDTLPINQHAEVAEKIRKHYLGSEQIDSKSVEQLIHMIGDRLFSYNYEKAARQQSKAHKSPVWTYYYTYRAEKSVSAYLGAGRRNFGVSHCDDIFLILDSNLSNTSRPEDKQMQHLLVDFYTSFAIQGQPHVNNVNWKPLNPDEEKFQYLHIGGPQSVNMGFSNNFAQKKFWQTINFDENKL